VCPSCICPSPFPSLPLALLSRPPSWWSWCACWSWLAVLLVPFFCSLPFVHLPPILPSLPPVLLRAPVPRSPPALCAEPAVRRHLPFVSLSPRALSREPCRPPLPLPPPVCLPVPVRLSVGQREASTGTMCIHTVALFSSPGRGAVRLHAKPAHTRQVALRCFPLSCYSHPSACSSRAGAPSTTVALCFPLPKSHVPWPAPPSTRRPGGLTDARCLLLHHRRRGAGHVTPRTYLAV
jgi:hypothetical protein